MKKIYKDMKKILFVEDDKSHVLIYSRILSRMYDVVSVSSVKEAIDVVNKDSIDLVLLDISLKDKESGLDFATYLKNNDKYKSLPIIVQTAHADLSTKNNCFNVGCDEVVYKPLDKNILLDTLAKYLKNDDI